MVKGSEYKALERKNKRLVREKAIVIRLNAHLMNEVEYNRQVIQNQQQVIQYLWTKTEEVISTMLDNHLP